MTRNDSTDRLRADKWLWAARFFKTRALAAAAIDGGHVHLNGARTKPGKLLRAGDELRIRRGTEEFHIIIKKISARRGPASEAVGLYEETPESMEKRAQHAQQRHVLQSSVTHPRSRPNKQQRRKLMRFRKQAP